jgi:uncharacterized membrane protein
MTRLPLSGSFRQARLLVVGFLVFSSCMDTTPTGPSPSKIALAKGGGNGPTVKSTDPDSATIDTTLNVRVFGSGYDQGSRADWAFKGVVSEKIVTNSTQFVSSSELVANITIAATANIGSHDVIVTTSSGKGGIGTELFEVTLKVVKLPTLGGTNSEAVAINDAGQAVGSSRDPTGYAYAVRWTNEGGAWSVRKIGLEATPAWSRALAINEQGTAVGRYPLERNYAAVWRTDGSMTTLGIGWANAINNFDVIVGSAGSDVAAERPAVWTPSGSVWTVRFLELLPGVPPGSCGGGDALGIGDDNVIVGFVTDQACVETPVLWRPTADGSDWLPAERLSPVGTLAKGVAHAIVGSTIVGTGYPCEVLEGCTRKAFRWTVGGAGGELGNLDARANGLNRAGYIVGSSMIKRRNSSSMTGFVWSPTTPILAELPSPTSVVDHWAWDINDASPRQAVGGGRTNRGFGDGVAIVWTLP